MKTPLLQPVIRIDYRIDSNTTRAFVMNNTRLELLSSFPEESKCSGVFCDRQRCIELVRSGKVVDAILCKTVCLLLCYAMTLTLSMVMSIRNSSL